MKTLTLRAGKHIRGLVAVLKDRKGVTALEYGVIAAAIIVVGLAILPTMGTNLNAMFTVIDGRL